MPGPINRIVPELGAEVFKTYELAAPVATHWRPATCAEADCAAYLRGWATAVPADSSQAYYIRADSGRRFTETYPGPGQVRFEFEAGQACFKSDTHQVPLEREPLYLVRGGDWRGDPLGLGTTRHARPADWVDDFGTHQERIADTRERG